MSKEVVKEIPIAARVKGPGPAAYSLPGTIGVKATIKGSRAPAYSFGMKYKELKRGAEIVPGPNKFFPQTTRKGLGKGPAFSIQGGFKKKEWDNLPKDTPGPNEYNPARVLGKEAFAPAYSIQPRRDMKTDNKNPGPSQYNVSAKLVSPSITSCIMQPKRTIDIDHFSPGPAAYETKSIAKMMKNVAPAYSLGARLTRDITPKIPLRTEIVEGEVPKEENAVQYGPTPGPAHYSPGPGNAPHALGFSFRVKHSEYESFVPEV